MEKCTEMSGKKDYLYPVPKNKREGGKTKEKKKKRNGPKLAT